MKKKTGKKNDGFCECGEKLPMHLADIAPTLEHVCSCERKYAVKDKKFILVGREENPFAAYDRGGRLH